MTPAIHRPPELLAAMQRTAEAARQLDRDAFAVMCWLDAEFPGLVIKLEVQRHYSCNDDQIAHVEPRVTDRPRRHEVRDAAEKALEALGWSLCPEGRDVHAAFYRPSREASAHAHLAAIDRVQKALNATARSEVSRPLADKGAP
ncbi:hypothetical protein [Roseovarius nanhaiticus]|uniref:hypothetical protein n=1 Tax=Roseovarius nanhaiticus TaxID=573024 RepID=UPI002491D477|nr:hypothetical protein [Roseovarius nanhaiticus]